MSDARVRRFMARGGFARATVTRTGPGRWCAEAFGPGGDTCWLSVQRDEEGAMAALGVIGAAMGAEFYEVKADF